MDSESSKDYEILGVIGSGSFGLIRKVIRKRDNMVSPKQQCTNAPTPESLCGPCTSSAGAEVDGRFLFGRRYIT